MAILTAASAQGASMKLWARWKAEMGKLLAHLSEVEQTMLVVNIDKDKEMTEVLEATEEQHRLMATAAGADLVTLLQRVREGTQYHIDLGKRHRRRLKTAKPPVQRQRTPRKRRGKNNHMGLKKKGKR